MIVKIDSGRYGPESMKHLLDVLVGLDCKWELKRGDPDNNPYNLELYLYDYDPGQPLFACMITIRANLFLIDSKPSKHLE